MSGEELKAADCPFCGAGLEGPLVSVDDTVYWMHPGVVTDKQCLLSGQGFTADQLAAWNRRHPLPEQPQEGDRYRRALEEIKRAVIDGKVCDDVAWFDKFTTLHDFIDMALDPPEPPVFRDLFPSTETKESGE